MLVKICGLKRKQDVLFCDSVGADFIGFIFVKESSRFVKNPKIFSDLRTKAKKVAVFMNQEEINFELFSSFDFIQFHGFEKKEVILAAKEKNFGIIKTIFPDIPESVKLCEKIADLVDFFLVDSSSKLKSQPGKFDEPSLISILDNGKIFGKEFLLSGGINPDNVLFYIERIKPFGIDVSSGVEIRPGVKSRKKIVKLIKAVNKNLGP